MDIKENINNSLNIIRLNKVRSFLTMLGIVIGIMGVIVIISVGSGAQSLIINQVRSVGSNLIGILPGGTDEEGPPASVMGIIITTLKYDDIKALKDPNRSPHVEAYSAYVRGTATAVWKGNKTDTTFIGASADLPIVEDTGVSAGHFFTKDDEGSMQRVAVIGQDVKDNLFADVDPIGQLVKIEKHNFRIVGVMEERGVSGFSNQDNQIYVPVTTAQKLLLGIDYISYARVKVEDENNIERAIEDIEIILREMHDIGPGDFDDFTVSSQKDGLEALFNITNAIRLFLAAIAGLALLVGGIGIMNIMLVSVQERIREIGLRKAVGAKNNQILMQFLIETVVLTTIAGIIGVALGIGISYLVSIIAQYLGFDWDFVISIFAIIVSVGISFIIGFIFGLVPARRASKLDPIDALRYE
ncbi:MAG: FtsX-like permease family protein [Candidatus Magasanikbacteria bacterium]|nr:FtsX-like permease family protein [Candidatus Magasanikbacteria bacterium]